MIRNQDILECARLELLKKWASVENWDIDIDTEEHITSEERWINIEIKAGRDTGKMLLFETRHILPEDPLERGEFIENLFLQILVDFVSAGIEATYEKAIKNEREQLPKSNFAQFPLLPIECKQQTNS